MKETIKGAFQSQGCNDAFKREAEVKSTMIRLDICEEKGNKNSRLFFVSFFKCM